MIKFLNHGLRISTLKLSLIFIFKASKSIRTRYTFDLSFMKQLFGVLFFFNFVLSYAQTYTLDGSAQFIQEGQQLLNPWSGGLEAGQYSTIDIDFDGDDDLVVFDRSANKINLFLNENSKYVYDPFGEYYFPEGINNWLLLRDYNCDGKKDIFTSDPLGMIVYENIGNTENGLSWRLFNSREPNPSPILTKGFSSNINLQVNGSDIPSIDDVDNDGDLDILVFKFTGSSTVEFHKNLSIERDGTCDSLQYERITQSWGDFQECGCGDFAFNSEACPPSGGREEHQSGKTLLVTDVNGDGNNDALIGEESCNLVSVLINKGDNLNPAFNSVDVTVFSELNQSSRMTYPAAFKEDVTFDGVKDLIFAPNTGGFSDLNIDFSKTSWAYTNAGSNLSPDYQFSESDFLQSSMIDIGSNAAPAFYDYDNDGDLDLFIGGQISRGATTPSLLFLYKNVGNYTEPFFEFEDSDPFSIALNRFYNIKPQFADIDGDGMIDLAFTATSLSDGRTSLYYLKRESSEFMFSDSPLMIFSPLGYNENVKVFDIDDDGNTDLLVGRTTGKLEFYQNGTGGDLPTYSLVDDTFYGFDFDPLRQSARVEIADLNGDTKLDMLIGDGSGRLAIYSDFKSTMDSPTDGEMDFISNDRGGYGSLNLGTRLIPSVTNIYGETTPVIILGTGQGGMVILRNENAQPVVISDQLSVYPNPLTVDEVLKVNFNKPTVFRIVNLSGQIVGDNIVSNGEPIEISVKQLKEGLYILLSEDGGNAIRFVVTR